MSPLVAAGYGASFQFTLLTADPDLAAAADAAGIDRVGLDIERHGKQARQGHLPHLRISDHKIEQLPALRTRLGRAQAFLRCNPVHAGSRDEIEHALDAGAQVLMLPYFRTAAEVGRFAELVDGRAVVSLLLETRAAVAQLGDILRVPGIGEVMVGLNDLQHDTGLSNPFEILVSPMLESVGRRVRQAGLRFGFGGLADPLHRTLPISPTLVSAQYPRLGATSAFVARKFTAAGIRPEDLSPGIARCRDSLDQWGRSSDDCLQQARRQLADAVRAWRTSGAQCERSVDETAEDGWQRVPGSNQLSQFP